MTQREATKLDQLSSKVERLIGSIQGNGGQGLTGQVKENSDKIDGNSDKIDAVSRQMERVQTIDGCGEATAKCREIRKDEMKQAFREELSAKGRNKWLVRKDAVLILVAVLSLVLGSGLLPRLVEKSRDKQTIILQQEIEALSRKMGEIEKAVER